MAKGGGTIWLGEHHNSLSDHHLQFNIIQRIHDSITQQQQSAVRRPKIAIGLEQVQIQFQSVLDNYSKGLITMDELREQVQWDKRWVWSFELYQPIFQLAKQLDIQLIALNVNTEDLVLVEQYGLPGLSPQKLRDYIIDA